MNELDDIKEQAEVLENVDDSKLLNYVVESLIYSPINSILVKPLEPTKIKRIVNTPKDSGERDEDGEPIMEMESKEVESDSVFRTGIVLALPSDAAYSSKIEIGSKIVFNGRFNSVEFDLFKDSMLVKPYDVLAVISA